VAPHRDSPRRRRTPCHPSPTMQIIHLHPRWMPTRDAAAELGLHVRTLQRRARAGRIATRTAEDGATLYALPPAGAEGTTPPAGATPQPHPPAALERLIERAIRAELELEHTRAELATARAELATARDLARDLAARLIRRGELLRRVAGDLADARRR